MKIIKSIPIWDKGVTKEAVILTLKIVDGQLFNYTTFLYQLLTEDKSVLSQGNIVIDGQDYNAWSDDDNYLFDWAAEQLNLTIIGDYVPPVVEEVVVESNEPEGKPEAEPIEESPVES
jgi:hypothetical protein